MGFNFGRKPGFFVVGVGGTTTKVGSRCGNDSGGSLPCLFLSRVLSSNENSAWATEGDTGNFRVNQPAEFGVKGGAAECSNDGLANGWSWRGGNEQRPSNLSRGVVAGLACVLSTVIRAEGQWLSSNSDSSHSAKMARPSFGCVCFKSLTEMAQSKCDAFLDLIGFEVLCVLVFLC